MLDHLQSLSQAFGACETGQYEVARRLYRAVVQANPADSLALYNLGATEFRAGNLAAAADFFGRVVNLKQHVVAAAYAKALCHLSLGRAPEWPPEYATSPGIIGVEGPVRNLAHHLQNRGYKVIVNVEASVERCTLDATLGQVKYRLTLADVFGQLVSNVFREEGGTFRTIIDPSINQNPTETDNEFISLAQTIQSLQLAQMPVRAPGETAPSAPHGEQIPALRRRLLSLTGGDSRRVEWLVSFERQHSGETDEATLLRLAIERWERDNRSWR